MSAHTVQQLTAAVRPQFRSNSKSRALRMRSAAPAASRAMPVTCAAASDTSAKRIFNFSAGPAMLPLDVFEKASNDMFSWQGTGMSVMEMSHRGKEFMSIASKAEADFRALLSIPDNYKHVAKSCLLEEVDHGNVSANGRR
eukprot:4983348-Pyramimonas_sp.AAC.1